jgi:S1-C subfamily serine protease
VGKEAPTDLLSAVRLVRRAKAGDEIVLRVRRDGKEQDITVKTDVLPFRALD